MSLFTATTALKAFSRVFLKTTCGFYKTLGEALPKKKTFTHTFKLFLTKKPEPNAITFLNLAKKKPIIRTCGPINDSQYKQFCRQFMFQLKMSVNL